MMLPTLFLSHGAPDLALHPEEPAHRFLLGLAVDLPRPRAIVVVSAHAQQAVPVVGTAAGPATIHDFGGFPAALYRMRYPAPGDPVLARRVAELLAGFGARTADSGLDHGAWTPLRLAWPAADIPVVPLSLTDGDAAEHLAIGRALAPLRDEGVLILASGAATHDLRSIGSGDPPPWVTAFADWLHAAVAAGDEAALCRWQEAPHARRNHPTPEHLLPLFVACGAAGPGARGRALHRSTTYGVLDMSAFAFS